MSQANDGERLFACAVANDQAGWKPCSIALSGTGHRGW